LFALCSSNFAETNKMKANIRSQFLLALTIAGLAWFSPQQLSAQSTLPPIQTTPTAPGNQAPTAPSSQPAPGTYDPRNPSNNYSTSAPSTTQHSPNNQSPSGQQDRGMNQNTNPVRPDPAQPGLSPNSAPVLQPSSPDVNNNKQVSPAGAGNVNPARKDSLKRKK
jgi:hypothetical protein